MSVPTPETTDEPAIERIMVVVAHPDDAEFSCAGTVARFTDEGKHVVFVLCTSGDKGTSRRDITSSELAALRDGEQS